MEMTELYCLDELTIGYGRNAVAAGLNANLCAGEMVCLIGRNGVGKSTLLRTMAGFLLPVYGVVRMNGQAADTYTPSERAKLISVVLTDRIDAQNMTVSDLVAAGRSPYTGFFGRMNDDDRNIVEEALRLVGMTDFANRMVDTLSDGERQKVMVAKALAQQTPVILLDEPTAFLDYPSKVETLQLLKRLCHEQHKAILISTHDLDVALRITDKVWMMRRDDNGEKECTQLLIGDTNELQKVIEKELLVGRST